MSSNRRITVEHNGTTYYGFIATIESTRLGYGNERGIMDAWLHLKWDGSGVGVGGFVLDKPRSKELRDYTRMGTAYGLDHIIRIMETVGVSDWESLTGAQVVVLFLSPESWGSQSKGIAGLQNDKVFIPAEHAQAWRDAEAVSA
jgi:hypothetical protein